MERDYKEAQAACKEHHERVQSFEAEYPDVLGSPFFLYSCSSVSSASLWKFSDWFLPYRVLFGLADFSCFVSCGLTGIFFSLANQRANGLAGSQGIETYLENGYSRLLTFWPGWYAPCILLIRPSC
jgi:hypothetical protein